MESEKTSNSQRNIEKESQSWWHHNSRLQALLQSCHHQDSMVLAQKQTHRSIEQNREPRNGRSTLWSTNLQQSRKEHPMEKRQPLQQTVLENWTATCRRMKLDHFLTTHTKIDSKWMRDLNVRQESIKILEENTGSNVCDLSHRNFLLDMSPKAREQKQKWTTGTSLRYKAFSQQRKQSTKLKSDL